MVDSHDPCELTGVRVLVHRVHRSLRTLDSHSVTASSPRRRASDWVGFFGHLAIAVLTVVRTPTLTLFLLPGIVHMMVAAGSFLVRDTPQRKEQDPVGRIVSYAGGFGVFGFVQFATSFRPEWLAVTDNAGLGLIGIALGFVGIFIEIWAVWHLRFSFATEPAARRLVTTGPYRLARHPIYSGGCLAYIGLLMSHPTVPLAIALTWLGGLHRSADAIRGSHPHAGVPRGLRGLSSSRRCARAVARDAERKGHRARHRSLTSGVLHGPRPGSAVFCRADPVRDARRDRSSGLNSAHPDGGAAYRVTRRTSSRRQCRPPVRVPLPNSLRSVHTSTSQPRASGLPPSYQRRRSAHQP